jgi:hypothetical protein
VTAPPAADTSAGTPVEDEPNHWAIYSNPPPERPAPKRPRSPPETAAAAAVPASPHQQDEPDGLAKKRRCETPPPPPPPAAVTLSFRQRQRVRPVQYAALVPHTEWRWTEPALLGPKDYEEVGAVDYGHPGTLSAWRDDETGVILTRVRSFPVEAWPSSRNSGSCCSFFLLILKIVV